MQYYSGDASFKFRSLDVPFHYHHSLSPTRVAAYNHVAKSQNEWNLKIGDRMYEKLHPYYQTEWFLQAINGRGWDSFFYATNSTTNQTHYKLYPYYKTIEEIDFV